MDRAVAMNCALASASRRLSNLPALTGLRGVLALWVVLYHTVVGLELRGVDMLAHAPASVIRLAHGGSLAVEMFFILSGLVMVHVHALDFTAAPDFPRWKGAVMRFWWLRLIRLWPVHALVLAAYVVINFVGFDWPVTSCGNPTNRLATCDRFDVWNLPEQLLLVAGWGHADLYKWNFVTWSISAEWLAYVGFPALVLATARIGAKFAAVLAVAVLAAGVPYLQWLGPTFHGLSDSYSAFRVVPGFLAGCLLGQMLLVRRSWSFTRDGIGGSMLLAAFLAGLLLVAAGPAPMFATIPAAALILLLADERPSGLSTIFASKPLQALGRLSYSLYVSHFLILELLGRAAQSKRFLTSSTPRVWLTVAASLVACVVVGALLHRFVEEPVRRRLRPRGGSRGKT